LGAAGGVTGAGGAGIDARGAGYNAMGHMTAMRGAGIGTSST